MEIAAGKTRLSRTTAFTARRWNNLSPRQEAASQDLEKVHFIQATQKPIPPGIKEILATHIQGFESFASPEAGEDRIVRMIEEGAKGSDLAGTINNAFLEGYGFVLPMPREFPGATLDLAMFSPWFAVPSRDATAPRERRAFLRAVQIFIGMERYRNWRREAWRRDGVPFWGPASLYYDEEPALLDRKDSLMCGPELFIGIPKEHEDRTREVLLPEDLWVHLWTSRQYSGGRTVVDAPRGLPAVFYKKTGKYVAYFDSLRRISCRLP
jgi:hypothetical protein